MTFTTYNTTYTLRDIGDGAFLLSGHSRFCPTPTRVLLDGPVEVGREVAFSYIDKAPSGVICKKVYTTTVMQVNS